MKIERPIAGIAKFAAGLEPRIRLYGRYTVRRPSHSAMQLLIYIMKQTGKFPLWLSRLVLAVAALISFQPVSAQALPQLPEPELQWKNVTVAGKKTAVFCMFRDSLGIMWAGTNTGLHFYDGVTVHPVLPEEWGGAQIYSIVEHGRRLFLGCNHGLLVYNYADGTIKPYPARLPQEIRSLLLIDGKLWVGGLYGIYCVDLATEKVEDHSAGLPNKSVYSILRDSRGILYAGTYNGLARWDSAGKRFVTVNTPVAADASKNLFVNCLTESADNTRIYIGSEGALYEYTPHSDSWRRIDALDDNVIKCMARGNNGHILVGTDNGVFDWNGADLRHYRHDSRHEPSLSDNEIWCILADSLHNIWAGHERGFSIASNSNIIRTKKLSVLSEAGEGNEIHCIYRDSRNNLWLGGTNGAIRLSAGGASRWYRHADSQQSLSHNRIRAIDEDSGHHIWLSTDGGLNRFNPQTDGFDIFHVVDSKGEHNTNWVYAFEEADGCFWIGSFLGALHRVDSSKFGAGGGLVVSDYSLNADSVSRGQGKPSLVNDLVNDMVTDSEGNIWILLFRDNILSCYSPSDGSMKQFDIHEMTGGYPSHLCGDAKGRVWCSFSGGAVVFDSRGNSRTVKFPHTNSDEGVLATGKVGDGIWVSTQSNVWRIDGKTFSPKLLPIPQKSYTAVYEDTALGKVLLGGTDEILEVDYRNLDHTADYQAIKLVLRDKGQGRLDLSDPVDGTKGFSIPYGGEITVVVSTLDYSPQSPRRFMYKLAESASDVAGGWIVMPEGSNTITLTDLKMGSAMLLVKVVGSPVDPVSIPLKVDPPLALSGWAICLDVLVAIGIIIAIVWYMRKRSLRALRDRERQTALENVERKLSFLSSISHDLKTPLSMILGPVSIMKEKTKDPENKKNLETIYENAVRLNNMIHRTLELQRMEDGDENLLILSTFDVVEFCRDVFEVFRENNTRKKFIFHSSCPHLFIEADAVKFESVITNLLSNACKYSDDGATISCGISTNGGKVEITVSDDGVGISDMDQPLVFQRMFRAPSTAQLHEGTGLGLYLIKKYLELMKGNIDLYSKQGQGTTFVVTLPLSEKTLPASSNSTGTDVNGKPKILIVEDNSQISAFLCDILKENYTYFTAENGRAGLAIASSIIPDLIIADEMMPIMNGLEMVRRIKQIPRLAAIPVIMLTAKSDSSTEKESIELGVDVFMTKPFEPSALMARISHLLKGRSELREKVRIQTIAQAEARPIEAESVTEKQLAKIAKVIEDNISDPDLNVNLLCEKSEIPNKQLYRLIRKYMGTAPLDYIRRVRLQKAAVLLGQHRFTVAEISYMVGFKTPSYFAKCFQNQYGVKPSQYLSEDENPGHK